MSEGPRPSSTKEPTRYCRKCWYVLDNLTENRCPECGRAFDPNNKRTYRTRPRGRWWLRLALRTGAVLLVVVFLTASPILHHVYVESRARQAIESKGGRYITRAYGPSDLYRWLHDNDLPRTDSVFQISFENTEFNTTEMVSLIGHLKSLQGLRCLLFTNCTVPVETARLIADLDGLEGLELSAESLGDEGFRALLSFQDLEELYLGGSRISDQSIAMLKQFSKLERLDLSRTRVTDEGLAYLSKIEGLKDLCLNGTDVSDTGLDHLSALEQLENLEVNGTRISDSSMAAVARMPNLKTFSANGTMLTNAACDTLARHSSLQAAFLMETKVTTVGASKFREGVHVFVGSLQKEQGSD